MAALASTLIRQKRAVKEDHANRPVANKRRPCPKSNKSLCQKQILVLISKVRLCGGRKSQIEKKPGESQFYLKVLNKCLALIPDLCQDMSHLVFLIRFIITSQSSTEPCYISFDQNQKFERNSLKEFRYRFFFSFFIASSVLVNANCVKQPCKVQPYCCLAGMPDNTSIGCQADNYPIFRTIGCLKEKIKNIYIS